MKLSIKQIAQYFSKHQFELTYPFLADTIEWHLVGGEPITGKENVVRACDESAQYMKEITTKFTKFKVISSDGCVVIDSLTEYIDKENQSTMVASCDIYEFANNHLAAITSYCIELK